jgi:hypothetical protein
MKDLQERIQGMIDAAVDAGNERGIQVAADLDGEPVVDAWGGFADPRYRLAVGVTKNLFAKDAAHGRIVCEIRRRLRIP